ncbi:unnamed protein product [Orchesella dallaii]|uniref:F-box domain-containing protein n=1 Tax=Orchesella dallaii TaxID=48710 RepID=A0ABP1RQU4_9HEXA
MSSTSKKVATDLQAKEEGPVGPVTILATNILGSDEMEELGYHHFPAENISEVWLNIYEKLGHQDKLTFSRTCAEWHDWVASKRTIQFFFQAASLAFGNLPGKEILQCRTLCRAWTEELGLLYQFLPVVPSNFYVPISASGSKSKEFSDKPTFRTSLRSIDKMKSFMADMEGHRGNPIPWGMLDLVRDVPDEEGQLTLIEKCRLSREYWTAAGMLLSKFGKYVRCVEFAFHEGDPGLPCIEFVDYFRNCLVSCPNVMELIIEDSSGGGWDDEIEEYVRLISLPQLKSLESLEIYGVEYDFADLILDYCCVPANIKRIYLDEHRIPQAVYCFSNLEILEVQQEELLYEDLILNFERFKVLEKIPPLKILEVEFSSELEEDEVPNLLDILTVVESFGNTLTGLNVRSSLSPVAFEEISGIRINLPKLQRLELQDYQGSLDLLVGLKSLTYLIIHNVDSTQSDPVGLAPFSGFEERIYESNIWKMVPSLKIIRIGQKTYRRQIYDQMWGEREPDAIK